MKFKAKTDENRKLQARWDLVNLYCQRRKPGTELEIEIRRKTDHKKDPIRKYYFAPVLPPFMEQLGYEPDETELFHRQLKIVYYRIKPDGKGIYRNVPSVFSEDSTLTMEEKTKFLDWVIRKAAYEGVIIESSAYA